MPLINLEMIISGIISLSPQLVIITKYKINWILYVDFGSY